MHRAQKSTIRTAFEDELSFVLHEGCSGRNLGIPDYVNMVPLRRFALLAVRTEAVLQMLGFVGIFQYPLHVFLASYTQPAAGTSSVSRTHLDSQEFLVVTLFVQVIDDNTHFI